MRLRPLTVTLPKPMLPVLNRPFIEHTIGLLREHGVSEVIISAGYLPAVFQDHLGDGRRLGVEIEYVVEETPLGTCGAVKNVEDRLSGTFIVLNGDILTDLDIGQLIEFHRAKKAVATLALTAVEDPTQYGLVPLDIAGRVVEFLEKPSWDEVTTDLINAGVYVLEPEVLGPVPAGESHSFERHLFPLLVDEGKPVFGFPVSAYWIDIGTVEKYLTAHRDILNGHLKFEFDGAETGKSVWIGEDGRVSKDAVVFGPTVMGANCRIAPHVTILGPTVLGDGCSVEEGARLEGCVLFDGVTVGEGAVVKNSILGRGVTIGKKVHVSEQAVLGDNAVIDEENLLRKGIKIWPDTRIGRNQIRF